MYLEIYIDTLFLINFIMDGFLLWILKKVLKRKAKWYRIAAGAFTGAVIACIIAIFPDWNIVLKLFLMYPLAGILVNLSAFGFHGMGNLIKEILLLLSVTFFFGGFLNWLYSDTIFGYYIGSLLTGRLFRQIPPIAPGAGAFLGIGVFIFSFRLLRRMREEEKEFYELSFFLNGREVHTSGFLDTGNGLLDPVTRRPVIIAEFKAVKEIFPKEWREYIEAFHQGNSYDFPEAGQEKIQMKLIPFKSIGKEEGLLLAVVFDEVKIFDRQEKENKKVITALYPGNLSVKGRYHVILHKDLL